MYSLNESALSPKTLPTRPYNNKYANIIIFYIFLIRYNFRRILHKLQISHSPLKHSENKKEADRNDQRQK